jgi:hypothetical protein
MKAPQSEASPSPRVHSRNIQRQLSQLIDHLEADIRRVDDRRFRGLLEKSSEVLKNLRKLFAHFGADEDGGRGKQNALPTAKKDAARSSTRAAKSKEKSAPASKRDTSSRGPGTTATSSANDSPAEASPAPETGAVGATAESESATTAKTLPIGSSSKSEDPDEIAAKALQQRREARAPKMPASSGAGRPKPPQSGKPIWSKPHSS